jgi:homoserine kinase
MGAFVSSLYEKDVEIFSSSLQDLVVEPRRSLLIPRFKELKKAANENDALAFGISGSGPSVFAIAKNEAQADQIIHAMQEVYTDLTIETETRKHLLCKESGARIVKK